MHSCEDYLSVHVYWYLRTFMRARVHACECACKRISWARKSIERMIFENIAFLCSTWGFGTFLRALIHTHTHAYIHTYIYLEHTNDRFVTRLVHHKSSNVFQAHFQIFCQKSAEKYKRGPFQTVLVGISCRLHRHSRLSLPTRYTVVMFLYSECNTNAYIQSQVRVLNCM